MNKLIGIFRKIIHETSYHSLQNQQYEFITSVAISVIEHKQLRQIASKLLIALAQTYPEDFNLCLMERKFVTSESVMFMLLHCSECVKHLKLNILKTYWEEYFRNEQNLSAIEDNKFIFGCRAFNAYIGAIEKHHKDIKDRGNVLDDKTFASIIDFGSRKCFNRDCRQVI